MDAQPAQTPGASAGPPCLEERKMVGSTAPVNSCKKESESRINIWKYPNARFSRSALHLISLLTWDARSRCVTLSGPLAYT